jgi:hypothetical protein
VKVDPAAIPFRRERLLSLGLLAFLAPVPLAFSFAVEAGWMVAYLCAVAVFLVLVLRGRMPCFSLLSLNLAGFAYAFLFYADLRFGSRRLLLATVHLLLFTTLMKLASIRKERDLSLTLILVAFLFLTSVATSIHWSIFFFLLVFLGVAWPVLVRWGIYRDLAGAEEEWRRDPLTRSLPGRGATAVSILATVLCAGPLFMALPRLRAPLVRGLEDGRDISTGFSESVDPDLFGILKRSDKVYLRVTADGPIARLGIADLRLRTLAFNAYDGRTWRKPTRTLSIGTAAFGSAIPLPGVRARDTLGRRALGIDLLPLGSRFLPYPIGSPGVRFSDGVFRGAVSAMVTFDEGRNGLLPMSPERTIHYEALFGGVVAADLAPPAERDATREALDSELVREWARRVTAGVDPKGDPEGAAAAIERELATKYAYSLEIPRAGRHPTEEFLLERKAGHCENFASAMALALRELGIPTRFVTGFAGGELGFLGRYLIVRGRDAHSWVEAWCGPGRGWISFDPTPPDGRPTVETVPLSRRLRQIGDGVELLYDRYILSFGQSDQMGIVRRMRESAVESAARFRTALAGLRRVEVAIRSRGAGALLLLVVVALTLLAARVIRRATAGAGWGRRLPPAAALYRRLQRALRRRGAKLTPASSPAETLAAARTWGAFPYRCAQEIVAAYAAASFGGVALDEEALRRIETRLRSIESELRRAKETKAA